jgi:hypothetical protein
MSWERAPRAHLGRRREGRLRRVATDVIFSANLQSAMAAGYGRIRWAALTEVPVPGSATCQAR